VRRGGNLFRFLGDVEVLSIPGDSDLDPFVIANDRRSGCHFCQALPVSTPAAGTINVNSRIAGGEDLLKIVNSIVIHDPEQKRVCRIVVLLEDNQGVESSVLRFSAELENVGVADESDGVVVSSTGIVARGTQWANIWFWEEAVFRYRGDVTAHTDALAFSKIVLEESKSIKLSDIRDGEAAHVSCLLKIV